MQSCPSCRRHFIQDESTCPFCGAAQPSLVGRALRKVSAAVAVVATPLVLAACYGPSVKLDSSDIDDDGDGYSLSEDCDDSNAAVNPGATEDCSNSIDDNCDSKVDADDTACAATE